MPSVPSVTMNGGRCSLVISVPLTKPQNVPASMQTTTPTEIPSAACGYSPLIV